MSLTLSPSSGRLYGLARVCQVWRAARATIYRHRWPPQTEPPRRPGPVGPMPDEALLETIRAVLVASPFHGEGHPQGLGKAAPSGRPDLPAASTLR